MKDGSTNRHGIPVFAPPPECIWPKCPKAVPPIPPLKDTRLCEAHAHLVHDLYDKWETQREQLRLERIAQGLEQDKAPSVRPKPEAVIYYLQVGSHIKIGWTTDLPKRLRQYPPSSQLLAAHPGTRAEEQRLHRKFAVWRTHGSEWYAPVPSIIHHIDMVKAEHGEPDKVQAGAKPVTIPQSRPKHYIASRHYSNGQGWKAKANWG